MAAKRRKSTPKKKTLKQLYATHRGKVSDRWSSYLVEYERIFAEYRDKPVRLLEIGIQNGGSLEIWSRYFLKARKIVGCDINATCTHLNYDDPRIAVVVGDANSDAAQENILGHASAFDIIIDDGSHRSSDIVKSFARYFPHLVYGGVFMAEDLHCSYWRQFEGGLYDPFSSITFFKRLADTVNHEHWGIQKSRVDILNGFVSKYGFHVPEEALQTIHSIQFMNSLCVVRKERPERNRLSRRVIAGSVAMVEPEAVGWHSRPTPLSDQTSNEWTARGVPPDEELPLRINELTEREERIGSLNQVVTERDRQISKLTHTITERDERITTFNQVVAERDGQVAALNQIVAERDGQIATIVSSRSWRITAPLRGLKNLLTRENIHTQVDQIGVKCADAAAQDRVEADLCRQQLAAHIDTPGKRRCIAGMVRFSGWCCHANSRIVGLTLQFAGTRAACRYGIERLDVNEAYPRWINSQMSGFEVTVTVPPAEDHVVLEALLENGQKCRFETRENFQFVTPPIWHVLGRRTARARHFTRYVLHAARDWRDRNVRWPSVFELPRLSRQVMARYRMVSSESGNELRPPPGFVLPERLDPYDVWLEANRWNDRAHAHLRARLACWESRLPTISVVMPVYNPPIEFLEKAIDSVVHQVYQDWELCIADDASTDPAVRRALEFWRAKDARINVVFRTVNGNISRATNTAAELASGEILLFIDHDDELTPDALAEVALHVGEYPDTDFLYSDDDKIDARGKRFAPQFKPDWSPELLLSYMYCSHVVAVRRTLFEAVGGMRVGFEGSQDYDFALRTTEQARRIGHIPLVLYHWRVMPGSTAASGNAKPFSIEAGRRAVQETFERRGLAGSVVQPDWAAQGSLGIFQHEFPDTGPSVVILIPTKNQLSVLRVCVESLRITTYRNYRVVIIDNESDDPDMLAYLYDCGHQVLRIGNPGPSFNFAYLNNRATEQLDDEYVLFLNNDTEVREPRWLSRMMGYAQMHGVGAVGARLLLPDGCIQHAGIVHGLYHGMAGPAFKLVPAWDHGYLSYARVVRNYSAVTAACLLTRRLLFLSMGGFDEKNFAVAYNDVDYCYRLIDIGHRCVYVPGAELTHHEGHSRGFADRPSEEATFRLKYGWRVDAWYSPHLSLADERFSIVPRRLVLGSMPPVRTLMAAFNLNLGGSSYSQYEMTVRLRDIGAIDPTIYCPEDGPLRRLYEEKGICVHVRPHPLLDVFTPRAYDMAIAAFADFVRSTGVDVVYGNTLQTFYAIAAAKVAGVPSIWNPRESEPWQSYFDSFGPEIAARALECFAYPYRVIFVADATRDVYAPLNSHHNFMVVHNGLDLKRLAQESAAWTRESARASLGVEPREINILLLGTVCPRKGQHDLPRALILLSGELHEQLKVFIVGDRPSSYSRELHDLVATLPETLRARVEIVPETADVGPYYRAADIFVCTSRLESYPRVTLEAMAYGLPIVTTPVYGIREQVRDGVNGIFYEPGKTNELARALEKLISGSGLREQLGGQSVYVLRTLNDFDQMVRQYASVFREASFVLS